MDTYIGLKTIKAEPEFRDGDAGYKVRYADGYESWSPAEPFNDAYRPMNAASFSIALEGMKRGEQWCRAGWNGKGMFVYLVDGSHFTVNRAPLLGIYPEGTEIDYRSHIDMKTADGSCVPWVASQSDLLAEDWWRFTP